MTDANFQRMINLMIDLSEVDNWKLSGNSFIYPTTGSATYIVSQSQYVNNPVYDTIAWAYAVPPIVRTWYLQMQNLSSSFLAATWMQYFNQGPLGKSPGTDGFIKDIIDDIPSSLPDWRISSTGISTRIKRGGKTRGKIVFKRNRSNGEWRMTAPLGADPRHMTATSTSVTGRVLTGRIEEAVLNEYSSSILEELWFNNVIICDD